MFPGRLEFGVVGSVWERTPLDIRVRHPYNIAGESHNPEPSDGCELV